MTTKKTIGNADASKEFLQKNLQLISLLIIFLFTYVPTLLWMWDRWFARDSYYSHGILIPFISGFLIWQRRGEWKKIKIESSKMGIPLVISGITVHLLSSLFRVYFTSAFSMLLVFVGLILYFYGTGFLRKNIFPIAFLIFMMPLPEVVVANISFKMKIFAAHVAATVLNNMRIPAVQEGSLIKMRNAYVLVEDVCSGLRSLISLTALGSIFAYWMKGPIYKRILLFLLTIPIAIITNVCRIVFLASVSEIWGPQYAGGLVHEASGFIVFGLAFVLLFAMGRLIE